MINYSYDPAGQLIGVKGTRSEGAASSETTYIKNIGYDRFGQRTFILYGNGVRTDYAYDPYRRWLTTLKTDNSTGHILQNLGYTFDKVGNVTKRKDTGYYSSVEHSYSYDEFFNMTKKSSKETRMPSRTNLSPLNYLLDYSYDEAKLHQATKIGENYYQYDENGNIIRQSDQEISGQSRAGTSPNETRIGDVRRVDQGWGFKPDRFSKKEEKEVQERIFRWDEENRLKQVTKARDVTSFLYDAEGERTSKLGLKGERLYFNAWWTATEEGLAYRYSKYIFVGSERIVTRLKNSYGNWEAEDKTTYYYHPDHLGSTAVVTDPGGKVYERIEYTPFGEMWVERQYDAATSSDRYIPYRFTSKEWDEETGLYSFPKRYYEPRVSRWMSADPAGFG